MVVTPNARRIHRCPVYQSKRWYSHLNNCWCSFAQQCTHCGRHYGEHLRVLSMQLIERDGRTPIDPVVLTKCLYGAGSLQLPVDPDWEVVDGRPGQT